MPIILHVNEYTTFYHRSHSTKGYIGSVLHRTIGTKITISNAGLHRQIVHHIKEAKQRFAGRYRPPSPKRSPLITLAGAQALKDELNELWSDKRPVITQAVKEAAALGDRSENAEYIYGKKMLREMDSRIRYLQKRIDQIKVVEGLPSNLNKVYFGAWVTLVDNDANERRYRIVGVDELNPSQGYISIDSPLALALVGKQLDDHVELTALDKGYDIIDIDYSN